MMGSRIERLYKLLQEGLHMCEVALESMAYPK
jgi:hypothetical protein